MFEFKPDYEKSHQRHLAFWDNELIDRPLVEFYLEKPQEERVPFPPSHHTDSAERWLDVEYQAEYNLAAMSNREFLGDGMPVVYPNLGPELFSALYGCPLHFGDYGTSWSDPILHNWSEADQIVLDWHHPYLKKLHELTDAFIEIGKGKFITGITDIHAGGDAIAAFRDPQNLAVDMLAYPAEIQALLRRVTDDYFKFYDIFYNQLKTAGLPITTWTMLVSDTKYYVPSNDFSIMISKKMFDEMFLPGIIEECQYMDHNIYHLDGPGALRHLDSLLSIKELDAVQWVFGAGNEGFQRWVGVYQKIQAAGKGIQVNCEVSEIDQVMETLSPRGLYLNVSGVPDRATGLEMIVKLEKWCAQKVRFGQA